MVSSELRASAWLLASGLLVLAHPRSAAAHIEITSHQTRHGVDQQKIGPCGAPGSGPGDLVYSYAPGETVVLSWNEFVDHPGHYRVAFDPSGADAFIDPASADDLDNSPLVVLDGIADEAGVHDYVVEISLPELECETCTIQIVQVMTDKPPFGDGDDLYYHCIDIRLAADPGPEGETEDEGEGGGPALDDGDTSGRGCSSGPAAPAPIIGGLLLLLLSGAAIRRRRR